MNIAYFKTVHLDVYLLFLAVGGRRNSAGKTEFAGFFKAQTGLADGTDFSGKADFAENNHISRGAACLSAKR